MIELEQKSSELVASKRARSVKIGRTTIKASEIGINDPIAHLYKFVEKGDEALDIIKEVGTGIAERLPNAPFVNYVGFKPCGDDFISEKDKVSMVEMTENYLHILQLKSMYDTSFVPEYERAKVEVEEVAKLVEWFKSAKSNSYLVFESLPIGKQKVAVTRIYQKTADGRLNGCFLSLYNPNVDRFNGLRQKVGVIGHENLYSELDILKNGYQFYDERLAELGDFVDFYVDAYDDLMLEQSGNVHRFGIQTNNVSSIENGIDKVKAHPEITSDYIEMLTAMRNSEGVVSSDLLRICQKIGIGRNLSVGQNMKTSTYRVLLKGLIKYMASTVDGRLNTSSDSGGENSYSQSYESLACPEIDVGVRSNSSESGSLYNSLISFEQKALLWAYGIYEDLPNFGYPQIGKCRIANCPSRKETKPCVVGGCGFCKECHKILGRKGDNDPSRIYKKEQEKAEKEKAEKLAIELKDKEAKEQREMLEKAKNAKIEDELKKARQKNERKILKYRQAAIDLAWSKKAA